MKHGLHLESLSKHTGQTLDLRRFSEPEVYTSEIHEFRKKRKKNPVAESFPIANQDAMLKEVLKGLAARRPNVIMVGEPGVGKSTTLDFVVRVLTGEVDLDEIRTQLPQDVGPLFDQVRKKLAKYEHMHYLSVPNLAHPLNVTPLSYTDMDELKKDVAVAEGFADQVAQYLKTYPTTNRGHLRKTLSRSDFGHYVRHHVGKIFLDALKRVNDSMIRAKVLQHPNRPIAIINAHFPKGKRNVSLDDLEVKVKVVEKNHQQNRTPPYQDMRVDVGYKTSAKGIGKNDIEPRLARELVEPALQEGLERLELQISLMDVAGLKRGDKIYALRRAFNDFAGRMGRDIADKNKTRVRITDANAAAGYVAGKIHPYAPEPQLSKGTLDHLVAGIRDIRDQYVGKGPSSQLRRWMDSVVTYFDAERKIVDGRVRTMLAEVEKAESKHVGEVLRLVEDADEEIRKDSAKKDIQTRTEEIYGDIQFVLFHAGRERRIEDILSVEALYNPRSSQKPTEARFTDMSDQGLFGTFTDPEEQEVPHLTIQELGGFFGGSILTFRDNFAAFVEYLVKEREGKGRNSAKEQFLEYLETGNLAFVANGVTFNFAIPRMILGCANEDPFVVIKGNFKEREDGLADRFTIIQAQSLAPNTKDTRRGTYRVMCNAVDRGNEENGHIVVEDAALDVLTNSLLISPAITRLDYRELSDRVQRAMRFTAMKGERRVTVDMLRQKAIEELEVDRNMLVDADYRSGSGFQMLAKASPGVIYGIAVRGDDKGRALRITSSLVDLLQPLGNREQRLVLIDRESELATAVTEKGFALGTDYLQSLLSKNMEPEVLRRTDWKVRTQFYQNWNGIDGPSATAAMSASIISALAQTPIYKNRLITGTMEPNGDIGAIGGAYTKAAVVARLQELAGGKDQFYYFFPAANLPDLRQRLQLDPMNVQQNAVLIPVQTFAQAYYLLTVPQITPGAIQDSYRKGNAFLQAELEKVNRNLALLPF